MPRFSERYHRLRQLRARRRCRLHMCTIRDLNQSTDDGNGIFNEDEDDKRIDCFVIFQYISTKMKRFFAKQTYCCRPFNQFAEDLAINSPASIQPFLNDQEFLNKYRMSQENFFNLVKLIKGYPVFVRGERGRMQDSSAYQLMVLLHYLASEGNGATNPNLCNIFKIGQGTAELYKQHCVHAINSLKDRFYFWPDEDEQLLISERIRQKFLFPNCVGMIDGTLNGLAFRPECDHASDYHGRKMPYSMSTTIVCDDKCRIQYYLAGWPGLTHNNRVFKSSSLFRDHAQFFTGMQYLLGDSAYKPLPFLVSLYKKPQGHQISQEKENFNEALSKLRVFSEHTIGIWKGRFPWLRNMCIKVTKDPTSGRKILDYISCTVILHNYLLEKNDKIPGDWINLEEERELSLPDNDPVNIPITHNQLNNYRHKQIMLYMNEHYAPH